MATMDMFERQRRRRWEEMRFAAEAVADGGMPGDAAGVFGVRARRDGLLPPTPTPAPAPSPRPSPPRARRPSEPATPHAASAAPASVCVPAALCTGLVAPQSKPSLACAMCDLLSFSVLQVLSVLSFLTSVLAMLCIGTGSLHRLSHKLDDLNAPLLTPFSADGLKQSLWSWNGLPVSFSLGTLVGDDHERGLKGILGGYAGGGELIRMSWQVGRARLGSPAYDAHPPVSMAKLIMSRHTQRRPLRLPRRSPGMPRPTPPSRLVEANPV